MKIMKNNLWMCHHTGNNYISISKWFLTKYPHFSISLLSTMLEEWENPNCTPIKSTTFTVHLCKSCYHYTSTTPYSSSVPLHTMNWVKECYCDLRRTHFLLPLWGKILVDSCFDLQYGYKNIFRFNTIWTGI